MVDQVFLNRTAMPEGLETLLRKWRDGDRAAGDRVLAMVYSELRRMAAYCFRQERSGHTLQPTALVHELFLKMSSGEPVRWQDRAHFFAVAARQMRLILIDHARRRKAARRDDTRMPLELAQGPRRAGAELADVLAVDEALRGLEGLDSRAARVVELRVFGGLEEAEIADALEISPATVKRDWTFARAWLRTRLRA